MIYKKGILKNAEVIEHRKRVRGVYEDIKGQTELFNLMHDAGLFSVIDPSETQKLANRNFIIRKLEEMGMLDQWVIRWMIAGYFANNNDADEYEIFRELNDRDVEDPEGFGLMDDI